MLGRGGNARRTGIALALAGSLASSGTAHAASILDHQRITRAALRDAGWTDDDRIERVTRCNIATDMARLHAVYRESLAFILPQTGLFVDRLLDLAATAPFNSHGTDGFHFNNLYSYSAIETQWREFAAWVDSTSSAISTSPDSLPKVRVDVLLGITTHAVQDYYSHSNWVEILIPVVRDSLPDQFPLWEELVGADSTWLALHPGFEVETALARLRLSDEFTSNDDRSGGLQTGKARGAPRWEGAPPWDHRHLGGAADDIADALALRASVRWIQRVENGAKPR